MRASRREYTRELFEVCRGTGKLAITLTSDTRHYVERNEITFFFFSFFLSSPPILDLTNRRLSSSDILSSKRRDSRTIIIAHHIVNRVGRRTQRGGGDMMMQKRADVVVFVFETRREINVFLNFCERKVTTARETCGNVHRQPTEQYVYRAEDARKRDRYKRDKMHKPLFL